MNSKLRIPLCWKDFFQKQGTGPPEAKSYVDLEKKYPFLAKRILQEYPNDILFNFLKLRNQIDQTVEPYKDSFAMYFEYLPTGTSIGINEDSEFKAASLLKVPIVMAYYHKKERLKMEDDPTVTIQEHELDSTFGDLYKKGAGYKINLKDAVKLALQESDNTANRILVDQIDPEDFQYVYEGLDIPLHVEGENPVVTPEKYAAVFESLYFSGALTKEHSQEILSYLTETQFNDMLPNPIPRTIPVAHKIGVIDTEVYEDCGIVYSPRRPYALCMISKSDHKTARQRMREISKIVYDYVSQVNK